MTHKTRREASYEVRQSAAALAARRQHPSHYHNHEENRHKYDDGDQSYIASFTKGLPHDRNTGLLANPHHYPLFTRAVHSGAYDAIRAIPLGPVPHPGRTFRSGISRTPAVGVRAWESMAAGLTFDLQGPDAQAVTIPPAPTLESHELAFEMTELYWMALLRDIPFTHFRTARIVARAVNQLNDMCWTRYARRPTKSLSNEQLSRLRPASSPHSVFRGNTAGDDIGPYISQFMLVGTPGIHHDYHFSDGIVQYGANRIDQRVRVAAPIDYMTSWEAWLDVQNGADLRGRGDFEHNEERKFRFITTPRDLATYVHFDALYQAYLNACIILLNINAPLDPGIPFTQDDAVDKQQGFATFGGPHILSLVTEVATRALKAVRFQKYNVHRRLRPEAVGGLLERFHQEADHEALQPVRKLYYAINEELLDRVATHNAKLNSSVKDRGWPRYRDYDPSGGPSAETRLLPMAYPEGSPMHPSYGAGHATVAGACVTILKAFFDHHWPLPFAFVPTTDGLELEPIELDEPLTVEGELNKLCSNVSIGRNWAGVHYFSDYFESIRMGEKIALGILEEQKLTYYEEFSMTVPLFDGTSQVI